MPTLLLCTGEFLYRLSRLHLSRRMRFYRQNWFRILLCLIVQAAVGVSVGAAQGSSETKQHSSAIEHVRQGANALRLIRSSQWGPSRLNDHRTPALPLQAGPVFYAIPLSEADFAAAARPLSREGRRLRGRSPPTLL